MMRKLSSVSMICADTTRSRAYLQNLARANLCPCRVLVLPSATGDLPGQSRALLAEAPEHADADTLWQDAYFNPNSVLSDDLAALGAPVITLQSSDINDPTVIAAVADLPGDTVIYSGFGGQILRKPVLSAKHRFLHVHGGYLPAFRGSTTNYFSLINEDTIGASAIFLTEEIDAGPILMRRRFDAPPDRGKLDHLHDAAARSHVLCSVLDAFEKQGVWPCETVPDDADCETYYVIHPVLKHLAVYGPEIQAP
jgi:methionyl-tRNA formyltransferase